MMNESTRTGAADAEPVRPGAITGEPAVDAALTRLSGLPDEPGAEHVEAFGHVCERLHGLLGELRTRDDAGEAPDDQADQA